MLADASLFLSAAMVLAVFDISKAVVGGVVDEPVVAQTTGTIRCALRAPPAPLTRGSHLEPFRCSITPRSERARRLILGEEGAAA